MQSRLSFRLNSMDYTDLKDKLQRPVRTAQNVIIHQSLSDRFVAAFTTQVQNNTVYNKPSDMVRRKESTKMT